MASTPGFVNLSGSESIDFESPDLPAFSSHSSEASTVKERRKWSPKEDVILISAWLNTSKDPTVGNEQNLGTFWSRIHNYYNSSVQHVGLDTRELGQCKQRWGRLNDLVCKFCSCYDAALRDQSSGENDNDVMKKALDMFFNDHGCKFPLEHAWRELRHDQKWCFAYKAKDSSKVKRKTVGGDVQGDEEVSGARPPDIKAAKAAKKKKGVQEESNHTELKTVLEMKDKLNKQKLLEKFLEKPDPLSEMEMSLKLKLMSEMLG
ncbi:PREDICTED: glutathione S-transferase T3-like [Brassica oleracea var. oleracea]|uniref:glutathione S-transferase T3-like n=1 Tax=Brassica oleracea var. oleracea TaxID=109376 RepID=UPI0006A6C78B|nr:PREDICTED: glutathione S-transferase T3-like [Brassica oleracea var. oleracea]